MSGPLSHPNIPSHVLSCRTCLDREAREREAKRQAASVDRLLADPGEWDEDDRRQDHETFDERDDYDRHRYT